MRKWVFASIATLCGCCGATIAVDAPLLIIELDTEKRLRFFRCPACAGESQPDPATITRKEPMPFVRSPLQPIRRLLGQQGLDFKARASGDREPGEEG